MKRILFSLALICSAAGAAPLADLSGGQTGRIEFQSITPPDRWQFVRKNLDSTKQVIIYGDLLMPRGTNEKIPAVVISHASGGVRPSLFDVWAKALNNAGVAVFIPDSFTPRGIGSTANDQGQLDPAANVADALYALKLLATHPRIDSKRIYHMGGSRGGGAAFETYWDMARRAVISDNLKFAGNIPLYQGNCNTRFRLDRGDTNTAPILALMGSADEGTPADECVAYYTELKQQGVNIRWKVYPGAHHGFDGDSPPTYFAQAMTDRGCTLEVFLTDIKGGGLGEARNYKTGQVISSYVDWGKARSVCRKRGYTAGENRAARDEAVQDVIAFIQDRNVIPSQAATAKRTTSSAGLINANELQPKNTVDQGTQDILKELSEINALPSQPSSVKQSTARTTSEWRGPLSGRIEFNSITMPSIWQYARRNLTETKATAIYGDLLLPPNTSGKVPALLISHGSSGVSPYAFEVWAKEMNAAGVAAFVIDSFKPRGISETAQDQSILSPAAMVADALNGLRLLASHPKIDASRIYHIGFSRGGGIAFYTAWPMYQRPVQTNGANFAGHIPVYPSGCDVRYRADTERATAPVFMAVADRKNEDWQNSATCERFANELAAQGQPVTFKEYPGTYHGFDGKSQFFYYNNAQTSKNCDMELQMTDVAGGGLGRHAKDFKTGKNLETYADWNAAFKSCAVNQRARVGGDSKQSAELVADVLKFMGVK